MYASAEVDELEEEEEEEEEEFLYEVKRGSTAAALEVAAEVDKGEDAEDSVKARRKAMLPTWPARGGRRRVVVGPRLSVSDEGGTHTDGGCWRPSERRKSTIILIFAPTSG